VTFANQGLMPMRALIFLLALLSPLLGEEDLPKDVAAAHSKGKWTIRRARLYGHVVEYYGGTPMARPVLPDYMRRRLIEDRAHKANITVTDADVKAWIEALDARIRKRGTSLEELRKKYDMSMADFRRRGRLTVLRERVARAEMNRRDSSRDPNKPLKESTVVLVIDEMYKHAKKVTDPKKLPEGVFAMIDGVKITTYQFGRELSFSLPSTEVARALNDLILIEEVNLLTGNNKPPTAAELAAERKWFVGFEMNRLRRIAQSQAQGRPVPKITEKMVEQVLVRRGLTLQKALANPASHAQAKARGHFRKQFDVNTHAPDSDAWKAADEALRKFYEKNKDQFGDELRVARILIAARAQRVGNIGQKIRTLSQGKAVAKAVHQRLTEGGDFGEIARQNSDDIDVIKRNGGLVPLLLTAATPGYEDTWAHANRIKEGDISKPFFSAGRGYVIVRLIERKRSFGFEAQRKKILRQASEQAYRIWRNRTLGASIRSKSLLEKGDKTAKKSG